jgi:hypothetical protein
VPMSTTLVVRHYYCTLSVACLSIHRDPSSVVVSSTTDADTVLIGGRSATGLASLPIALQDSFHLSRNLPWPATLAFKC